MQMILTPTLLLLIVIISGCSAPPVEVEPLTFEHSDEVNQYSDFIILADRRIFATMAFLNAVGYDDQRANATMFPVRVEVRQNLAAKEKDHSRLFLKWRDYYKKRKFGTYVYQDYALSLSSDYPFKRIRPYTEGNYSRANKKLTEFPEILNEFWNTLEMEDIWQKVKPVYIERIKQYNPEQMSNEVAFTWEYLRLKRQDHYIYVSVPNYMDERWNAIGATYENYHYAVESTDTDKPSFNIHEYLHSIINRLVNENYNSYKNKLDGYYQVGKSMPLSKSYQELKTYTAECLVRALDHRIQAVMANTSEEYERRAQNVANKTQAGLLLSEPFYKLLIEYEQSDLNFEEYMPVIFDRLPEYSEHVAAK